MLETKILKQKQQIDNTESNREPVYLFLANSEAHKHYTRK